MSDLKHADRAIRKAPQPSRPPMRDFYMPAMPPLGLITALENAWKAWRRRRRFRRRFLPLLAYDDHTLDDMGYRRSDIEWALSLPLREDALGSLEKRRAQRSSGAPWAGNAKKG